MSVNIHINQVNVTPDVMKSLLGSEIARGVDPEVLADIGYTDVPQVLTPESEEVRYQSIAERYEQAEINATARVNFLGEVFKHADPARGLQGFQTNHQRRPEKPGGVNAKQHSEKVMASESLKSACGMCALSKTCSLNGNIDAWFDVHPYKRGPSGRKRPGSLPVKQTESRIDFMKVLRADPYIHCDPAKRK